MPVARAVWPALLLVASLWWTTDQFGKKDWYPEGAKWLLRKQDKDGSWIGNVSDNVFRAARVCRPLRFFRLAA